MLRERQQDLPGNALCTRGPRPVSLPRAVTPVLVAVACAMSLVHLETTPRPFWDEGWTISVARNWIERGHYGQLIMGEHAPPGLAAQFPVVLPVALSFRLFGVGLWQARLPGVFFTLGTLALMSWIAQRLVGRGAGVAVIAATCFLSFPSIHLMFIGRQALAEVPMMFFLLAGYALFLLPQKLGGWSTALAVFCWATALIAKLQPLPFFAASLSFPLVQAIRSRDHQLTRRLAASLGGAIALAGVGLWLWTTFMGLSAEAVPGLYGAVAFVPFSGSARLRALLIVFLPGLPTVVGTWYILRERRNVLAELAGSPERYAVGLGLFVLAATWLAWFVFFSVAWSRHLFPVALLGSMFVAVLILVEGGRFVRFSAQRRRNDWVAPGPPRAPRLTVPAAIVLALFPFGLRTVVMLFNGSLSDSSMKAAARYVDDQTPTAAIVETYDAELWFLIHRRYHYPPDRIHVDLIRRTFLGETVTIAYDPLPADPDFLVVGPQSKTWHLYDSVLAGTAFRHVRTEGLYDIYRRNR
jgi:4-amino-4-deoxy-L-arabinose transferase-like glycosyltransferase